MESLRSHIIKRLYYLQRLEKRIKEDRDTRNSLLLRINELEGILTWDS